MSFIVLTGKEYTVTHTERCANCGRNLQIGETAMGAQIHYDLQINYKWGRVHFPECPIKTKTWCKNNPQRK